LGVAFGAAPFLSYPPARVTKQLIKERVLVAEAEEWGKLPGQPNPAAMALKHELSKIILWNEREAPRSRQVAVGPSELGTECDRRLAYRIAGAKPVNTETDPWPSIVGTSIHSWLDTAINRYQNVKGDLGYLTETRVYPDPLVKGRSDLFNTHTGMVIDHKSAGVDVMRKIKKGIIPNSYRVQIQVYGLGHKRAGREVNEVALVFYPRSGWLGDVEVWLEKYDEKVALDALARMYELADKLMDLDIENNPHRYGLIPATPGDACVWCPFHSREKDMDVAADDKGCPGR
jgi:hypothetical protein